MLKNKLINNEFTIGSWITIGNLDVAEIMAKANYDWLVIDLEHSSISIDKAGDLIRTIDLCDVPPLVRITSNDANQIKRVMDAGAHGIVVPMIKNQIEAEYAVSATRYAPQGSRGVGLGRAQGFGAEFKKYLKWQTNSPVVIAQIEHIDAIENLSAIISVPGIDGIIIGPYDLSCSMGIPGQFENDNFISIMSDIQKTGAKMNIPTGIHIVEPDVRLLKKSIKDGYNFIAYSVDIRMLDVSSREAVKSVK